jgi:hypothetical protein
VLTTAYAYDPDDNVSSITDAVTPGNSQAFAYDVMDRPITAGGGYVLAAAAQNYAYNASTNQLHTVIDGGTTEHQFA